MNHLPVLCLKILCVPLVMTLSANALASDSRLIMSGGITSFEGTAGGGITPWALIGGYASEDEIDFTVNAQS